MSKSGAFKDLSDEEMIELLRRIAAERPYLMSPADKLSEPWDKYRTGDWSWECELPVSPEALRFLERGIPPSREGY